MDIMMNASMIMFIVMLQKSRKEAAVAVAKAELQEATNAILAVDAAYDVRPGVNFLDAVMSGLTPKAVS